MDLGGSWLLPKLVGLQQAKRLALLADTIDANEARAQPGNFATADSGEAYAAFAAKREASFTGQWAVPPRSEQKDA